MLSILHNLFSAIPTNMADIGKIIGKGKTFYNMKFQ